MRARTPKELLMQFQGKNVPAPVAPLPGQMAVPLAGVADVSSQAELAAAPVNPDDAIVTRMARAAVAHIQHRQRREKLIAAATQQARVALGLASDQRELDQEIKDLVTKDLG